jgi:hypothetical protein
VFNHCLEDAVYAYLLALKVGTPTPSAPDLFNTLWQDALVASSVDFRHPTSAAFLQTLGRELLDGLPAAWEQTGLDVAVDGTGEPMIQKPCRLVLGARGQTELEFHGCICLLARPRDPLDARGLTLLVVTPVTSPFSPCFTRRSDLLTGYQLLADAYCDRWDGELVAHVGFWNFIKARTGARIVDPALVPARRRSEMTEYVEKLWWIAESAARNRFSRTSRDAVTIPCPRCVFLRHCLDGDATGLRFSTSPALAAIA